LEASETDVLNVEVIKNSLLKKYKNLRVLLKIGHKGCHYITNEFEIKIPAAPELNSQILKDYQIVDTTGAGDGFTAAFFVKYKQLICKLHFGFP